MKCKQDEEVLFIQIAPKSIMMFAIDLTYYGWLDAETLNRAIDQEGKGWDDPAFREVARAVQKAHQRAVHAAGGIPALLRCGYPHGEFYEEAEAFRRMADEEGWKPFKPELN